MCTPSKKIATCSGSRLLYSKELAFLCKWKRAGHPDNCQSLGNDVSSQRRRNYQIMVATCRRIGPNLSIMSVRVVARIRPLLKSENEVDTIVRTAGADEKARPNIVKVPNPKNFSEQFSFQFNSVYGEDTTQQEIFDAEGELGIPLELTMILKNAL
jgi:hypothetical protein